MLATVGVPPMTAIAPPFTRILPAASRLTTIELSALSPNTVSTPALNVAVVAAFAGTVAPAITPAASRLPASSRRAERRQGCSRRAIIISPTVGRSLDGVSDQTPPRAQPSAMPHRDHGRVGQLTQRDGKRTGRRAS